MREEIIKELNYGLITKKRTVKDMAEFCKVSRPTMAKLVNEGIGTTDLLHNARKFLELKETK